MPTATAAVCSRNPTISGSAEPRRRLAERRVGLERRRVERGHQLGREHRPHDLADRVRGDEPDDAQSRGELRRDRRLADAGGAADQDHERHVELLDLAPPQEVLRVAVPGGLGQHLEGQLRELVGGERRGAPLAQALLDLLGHLIRPERRQPGDHDLRRHESLGVRQPRLAIGDHDVRGLGSLLRHALPSVLVARAQLVAGRDPRPRSSDEVDHVAERGVEIG